MNALIPNYAQQREYSKRRQKDDERVRIIERFVDSVYHKNKFDFTRVNTYNMQTRGVDVIHHDGKQDCYIDEKYALNYYNKDLNTFAFELYSCNNPNCDGWLISEHMITTHYAILWFRADEALQNIASYDLCYIPKQKLMDYLYAIGYYDGIEEDFLDYWEYDQYTKPNRKYYEKNNRRYLDLKCGVRIVQSMQYAVESPINIVIPRKELYKLAELHFHN